VPEVHFTKHRVKETGFAVVLLASDELNTFKCIRKAAASEENLTGFILFTFLQVSAKSVNFSAKANI